MAAGLKGVPGEPTRDKPRPPEEVLLRRFFAELGFTSEHRLQEKREEKERVGGRGNKQTDMCEHTYCVYSITVCVVRKGRGKRREVGGGGKEHRREEGGREGEGRNEGREGGRGQE